MTNKYEFDIHSFQMLTCGRTDFSCYGCITFTCYSCKTRPEKYLQAIFVYIVHAKRTAHVMKKNFCWQNGVEAG